MKSLQTKLIEILTNEKLLTEEQLKKVLDLQQKEGGKITKILVQHEFISEKDLLSSLSKNLNVTPIDLAKYKINSSLFELIPKHVASFYQIIPLAKIDNVLTVAMTDPLNILAVDDVKLITGLTVIPVIGSEQEIIKVINNYSTKAAAMEDVIKDLDSEDEIELTGDPEEQIDLDKLVEQTEDAPVIRMVNLLLVNAIKERASDIHLEPFEKEIRLRYRIDGVLYEFTPPPKKFQDAVISRVKIMSNLDIAERRIPQDGRFRIKIHGREIDFRTSLLPTVYGEKAVMRVLDKNSLSMDINKLGFHEKGLKTFKEGIRHPHGMILLTGPTGSGKTTTLYSALREVNTAGVNIITVEDPVEYQLHGINQIQVNVKAGLTFASGLRSILRQDPDIVMVGEIRDLETADVGVKAALTGHLVLSTLHTNDAPGSITRMIDMGIEPFLVASSVVVVAAQRLVRKICNNCKEKVKVPLSVLEKAQFNVSNEPPEFIYHGKGCSFCKDTGYLGRLSLLEVLLIDDDIRQLVVKGTNSAEIKKMGIEKGMQTLRMVGLDRVREGMTTLEEVLRITAQD